MALVSADISSLLHRWEIAEYVSEAFVILGCGGELVADFFKKIPERMREHIGTCSTVVLILALSVGLKCLIRTNELSGDVIGSLGNKAAEASGKSDKAISDSQKADLDSSKALTKAANALIVSGKASKESAQTEIHLTAAVERTKRLEAQLSWRTVTPEQARAIKDFLIPFRLRALSPLENVKIRFTYIAGDQEAAEYAAELKAALSNALEGCNSEISDPTSEMIMGQGPPPEGIFLGVSNANNRAAVLLQRALKNSGIDAAGEINGMAGNTINLFVAMKPRAQ